MKEAARTCEMVVKFYQTKQHYNPEESHHCTHFHKNLKSYLEMEEIKTLRYLARDRQKPRDT
jgi:hypothetical protein